MNFYHLFKINNPEKERSERPDGPSQDGLDVT